MDLTIVSDLTRFPWGSEWLMLRSFLFRKLDSDIMMFDLVASENGEWIEFVAVSLSLWTRRVVMLKGETREDAPTKRYVTWNERDPVLM